MPITLPPLSRRRFLAGSLAAGASLALSRLTFGDDASAKPDPNRVALLSDIHVSADKAAVNRGVVMYDHAKQALGQVAKLDPPPAFALVNGDCAYLMGGEGDYQNIVELLEPVRTAGLPIHLAMGNHDQRDHFWKALPPDDRRTPALADRQVLAIETPRADWLVLDSLNVTKATPGTLGPAQREWLIAQLDARKNKPVLVTVHHNPDESANPEGLTDTRELLDILVSRKQAKALFFGHTHEWTLEQREGLHLVNLPAVAYVFNPKEPSAWVDAHLADSAIHLELRTLDANDSRNHEKVELAWR